MGRHDDAQKLLEDAEALDGIADSDLGQGEREVERAAEIHRQVEVEDLAVQVVEGHQNLAVWQGAINNITRIAEHHISADQYAHAAGGSAKGKQLRSEILSMGDWLNRNLSQPIEDVKQAAHIVGRIFELVAAVLTVYDHVPEPVKQALGRALTTLGPFAAYLGFVH